jgi:hypothetical protein
MTATTSVASRRRRRASMGRASGLAPRSMIIVFAPFTRPLDQPRPLRLIDGLGLRNDNVGEGTRRDNDDGEEFPGSLVTTRKPQTNNITGITRDWSARKLQKSASQDVPCGARLRRLGSKEMEGLGNDRVINARAIS